MGCAAHPPMMKMGQNRPKCVKCKERDRTSFLLSQEMEQAEVLAVYTVHFYHHKLSDILHHLSRKLRSSKKSVAAQVRKVHRWGNLKCDYGTHIGNWNIRQKRKESRTCSRRRAFPSVHSSLHPQVATIYWRALFRSVSSSSFSPMEGS